jgi:F-type H+-transporting ATPase subunit gamma
MSLAREINQKIHGIRNTQKITRAMEMVAASKTRKAQHHMQMSRAYLEKIQIVFSQVMASAKQPLAHPYLITREPKAIGIILISSDRGLCGGLNINLFKLLLESIQSFKQMPNTQSIEIALVGHKGGAFVKRLGCKVFAHIEHLGDHPTLQVLSGFTKVLLDRYQTGQLDRIVIASNRFINSMTQTPALQPLLPLACDEKAAHKLQPSSSQSNWQWEYFYEPDLAAVLSPLMTRTLIAQIYQAVLENIACEQAARRMAMQQATENAGELISQLHRSYHKARQSAITQELAEIVSGAKVV